MVIENAVMEFTNEPPRRLITPVLNENFHRSDIDSEKLLQEINLEEFFYGTNQ
jgi:hypothetical protein